MLVIDLIIVALTLGMAAWGFSRGVTVGALGMVGFGAGAIVGSRLAPLLLDQGLHSTYAPILALPGALLFGGLFATLFERFGFRIRGRLTRLGRMDGILGGLLAGCLGLVAAWLVGALLAQVHSLRDPLVHSTILKRLDGFLPPPGPILVADTAPVAFIPTFEGPAPRVGRPNARIARDRDVAAAGRKVAKITALGCGHGGSGSGWIVSPGILATNSHVVAGRDVIAVRLHGRRKSHDATPILFDRKNDVALLRVPDLQGLAPLPVVTGPRAGTSGAVLGYPGGRWDILPVRLGPTSSTLAGAVQGEPGIPGRRLFGTLTTSFAGRVRPGNSGGPIVDARGRVLAMVFAGGGESGVGVPNAVVRAALGRTRSSVGTGQCEDND